MSAPTFSDLVGLEVEHMVSATTGEPLVKIRCLTGGPVIALGQIDPAAARQIAGHLLEAAARAEYEVDAITGLRGMDAGLTDREIGAILSAVRHGEVQRHTSTGEGGR